MSLRPERKGLKLNSSTEENQRIGYNKCREEYEKFLPNKWEIQELIKTTKLGAYYPIGEKDKPAPEPRPLFIHDYRVDLGGLMALARAINKRIGGEE